NQESRLPPGSDFRRWVWITIAPFVTAEDEWETDICVTEVISAQEDPPPARHDLSDLSLPDDPREPALEIDLDSVSVHGIRAARFEYSTDAVRRSTYHYTPRTSEPAGTITQLWDTASGHDDFPF
ncbi:hypothetical protein OFN60_22945, partial [Escherichia coli]|nr:hypothetical protein [Escherichia coli]